MRALQQRHTDTVEDKGLSNRNETKNTQATDKNVVFGVAFVT